MHPGIDFPQGDKVALKLPDAHCAGLKVFPSLVHVPPATVLAAVGELRRALCPGGLWLAAFYIGGKTL